MRLRFSAVAVALGVAASSLKPCRKVQGRDDRCSRLIANSGSGQAFRPSFRSGLDPGVVTLSQHLCTAGDLPRNRLIEL